ncbi:MAG TPA: hypothetical protein VJX74_16130 [Blastocatellia bacterium]|nr:hypothetical protein [Blastocatellia bacterium]
MGEVTGYTLLTEVDSSVILYAVATIGGVPTSKSIAADTVIAAMLDALPQPIDEAATPAFARLYLESSPSFDLAANVLGVGEILSHSSTVTIPSGKVYDHVRFSKSSDGGYNVFIIGDGGIVTGLNFNLQAHATSHANSNIYGVIGALSNKGPGSAKAVYGRAVMETGCTGVGVAGVFALRAVSTAAHAWIVQLAGTSETDFAIYIHSDDTPSPANFADGIVYDPNIRIESGGAFLKAFQTSGHDGDYLHYMTQLGATLFKVDKDGKVTAPNLDPLVTSLSVNLRSGSPVALYTVPSGKHFAPTKVILLDPTSDAEEGQYNLGFDAGGTDVHMLNQFGPALNKYSIFVIDNYTQGQSSKLGAAGDVLKLSCSNLPSASVTGTALIFGYLY